MPTILEGYLRELTHRPTDPIAYRCVSDTGSVDLNDLLGQRIEVSFTGRRACVACGRSVNKLYQSGYCFPCVTTLAECDLCIVKPHECHFHLGTCRDESFGETHCMIPHYVYLAFSSGIKVGLTRKGRQLTRWVDQGAAAAVLIAELPSRKAAGKLEMEIASFLPDKTQWRKMLALQTLEDSDLDTLRTAREQVLTHLQESASNVSLVEDQTIYAFQYPRLQDMATTLKSLSLDKTSTISGVLHGIKGQYLLLDEGVLNVKKHSGMHVQLSVS